MAKLTKNFSVEEMQCPCCNACNMDFQFMEELQRKRELCSFGFKVNSAYRCKEYNNKVSSNSKGQHATGHAVDIDMKDRYKRFKLLKEAIESMYFKDIAIAGGFIHLGKGNTTNGIGVY